MLKEQVLFLPLDEHGKAVAGITVVSSPGGAEVAHCFDWEGTSIRPGDRYRLHETGWVECGIDFYIDFFFIHDDHLLQQSILLLELPYLLGFYFFKQMEVIISRKLQRTYLPENFADNGNMIVFRLLAVGECLI